MSLQEWLRGLVLDALWHGDHTQAWLAEQCGYSQKHISQVLNGVQDGSVDSWDRMLRACQVSLSDELRTS